MYECFHCGHRAVIWGADFDYEDYGMEGKGIIHECSCTTVVPALLTTAQSQSRTKILQTWNRKGDQK